MRDAPDRIEETGTSEANCDRPAKALSFHPADCAPAFPDKRFLVKEEEFASTLRVMKREASILSPVLRGGWDGVPLQTLTKNFPVKATDTHLSIIAHVTTDDLRRDLTSTEMGNGFANRYLWTLVRRSKLLPEGGKVPEEAMNALIARLRQTVEFAKTVARIERDSEARKMWIGGYAKLSREVPGLVGSVLSRAEAQVMRMSCLYALLDQSETVRVQHLQAAIAVWEYTEESAKQIFGTAVGDSTADSIVAGLRSQPNGMTRTEIRDLFHRNKKEGEINNALEILQTNGIARSEIDPSPVGRSAERWVLQEAATT